MTWYLNYDILSTICEYLEVNELLNFSLACQSFQEASNAYVYRQISLKWSDVEAIDAYTDKEDRRLAVAKTICIKPDYHREWTSSLKLPRLAELTKGSLVELQVTCSSLSSGWLKYIERPLGSVRRLKLTTTGAFQHFSFDFAHIVRTMPNLEEVSLGDVNGGFVIDPYMDEPLSSLTTIRIENCEWHYPSRVSDLAANCCLENLEIAFTQHMHPFVFSERLKSEFSNLPSTLTTLNVHIDVGKRINWNPLQKSKPLVNLKRALLHGFEFQYRDDKKLTKFPELKELRET